jgi:hypothetical protein
MPALTDVAKDGWAGVRKPAVEEPAGGWAWQCRLLYVDFGLALVSAVIASQDEPMSAPCGNGPLRVFERSDRHRGAVGECLAAINEHASARPVDDQPCMAVFGWASMAVVMTCRS